MRWFALKFWGLGNRRDSNRSRPRKTRYNGHKRRLRLEFDTLEDRTVPSTTTFGVVSGTAFIDHNADGAFDAGEIALQGASVTLSGTANDGSAFSQTTSTDSNGMFAFRNVTPGTYQLNASATGYLGSASFADLGGSAAGDVVSALSVAATQFANQNVAIRGLDPHFINPSLFLNTTTQANFPSFGPTGSPANSAPFVVNPIANVVVAENAAATQIDLAGAFSDPDITNSTIRMDLNTGQSLNIQLFNSTAPQTVANFMDYVDSGAYDDSFFHRLSTSNPDVLQGGGFTFDPTTSSINTIPTLPAVPNEFGASNVADTLAMAATGAGVETDQFYFNVADNSAGLDPGKFTVFGQLESGADDAVLNDLSTPSSSLQVLDESVPTGNSNFATLPLLNYSGGANNPGFPGNSNLSNYIAVQDVAITSQNDFLTYSVVSNSNPGLLTATLANEHLTLSYLANATGTASITVQATDEFGASVQTSFQVTVVPLTINPVAAAINVENENNSPVKGTAAAGASVSVTATDGTTTTPAVTATNTGGAWMASVNVGSLKDGTITYTASTTDPVSGKTVSVTQMATKATVVPNLAISTVTAPGNISGTAPAGASVSVTATDGTTTTMPAVVVTADSTTGVWTTSGSPINISSLSTTGLITYTATTTDSNGNMPTATTQVSNSTTVTAPAIFITNVGSTTAPITTNPINTGNQTTVSVSGKATPGASVSVVVKDASGSTVSAGPVTADPTTGAWTVSGINASSLANGLITYTATATVTGDTNTAQATAQATKQP